MQLLHNCVRIVEYSANSYSSAPQNDLALIRVSNPKYIVKIVEIYTKKSSYRETARSKYILNDYLTLINYSPKTGINKLIKPKTLSITPVPDAAQPAKPGKSNIIVSPFTQ